MSWDTLETCTWRGVTFEARSIRSTHARRLVGHSYPYRDGEDHDDQGRAARRETLRVVFMGPTYETDLGALTLAVADNKAGTFTHPTMGSFRARIEVLQVTHDAEARDMAEVDVDVVETGTDQVVAPAFSIEALSDQLTSAAAALTAAYKKAAAAKASITARINDVKNKAAAVKRAATEAVQTVDRGMNDLRRAVATTTAAVEAVYPPNIAGEIRTKCQVLVHRADQIAAAAKMGQPRVVQHEQRVEGPAVLVAAQYGSAENMDAMLQMNRIRNPLRIQAGERIAAFQDAQEDEQ